MHPQEPADETLLRRVAQRDMNALELLYRRYHPRVSRFLLRVSRQPELIEEVYNDVMLVVWQSAGKFRFRSKVSTWIMGIAYRRGLKTVSKQGGRTIPLDTGADGEATDDRHLEAFENRRWLECYLAQLSPEHRAVIELTYYFELSQQEIADIVGRPVNTVKTRMFHARNALRAFLSQEFHDLERIGRRKYESTGSRATKIAGE
ncbi:MAG: sigma-70 family RNA polymerase sigma factor [Pseudomonadales bacterium]